MDKNKNYFILFWFLAITITYINCDGELFILDQSQKLEFHDQRPLYTSELKYVFGTILGYLKDDKREWQDLHIDLPVDYGKVVLALARIPGLKSAEIKSALVKIPLIEDEVLDLTYKELHPESTTVFNNSTMKPSVQHFDVSKNTEIYEIGDENPNPLVHAGYRLYDVIFKEIRNKKDTNHSALVWADFPRYDESNKDHYKGAFESLDSAFKTFHELTPGFKNLRIVIGIITHEDKISMVRRKRETNVDVNDPTVAPAIDIKSLNLADDYDENFPVIFNIILWFSVSLLFSLIAICMVIASMDPGRDSIIYRMTSTRMKKDN